MSQKPTSVVVSGFIGGSRDAEKVSPLLLSWFPENGFQSEDVMWDYITAGNETPILQRDGRTSEPKMKNGSVLLQELDLLEESHIYQGSVRRQEMTEKLRTPQIVQEPDHIINHVWLRCIVRQAKASSISWRKDNKEWNRWNSSVSFGNHTLFIQDMEVTDCGVYTCIVKNEVSTSSNSHVLAADETLFILVAVLFISVVALASSLTSFVGEAIIIIAMKKLSGPNQQRELTAIFVAFQLVSITCLLIASVLAVFESEQLERLSEITGSPPPSNVDEASEFEMDAADIISRYQYHQKKRTNSFRDTPGQETGYGLVHVHISESEERDLMRKHPRRSSKKKNRPMSPDLGVSGNVLIGN
ncbi:uncharacterized protein LOC125486985 [Rhincodon typus]|uniref:uncharacterized protein LOC125486985 n=1 Tax=Rhincodon typus TaxID=259920 RepID=UPI00202E2FD7|nr:uncharacterized protein LOC125486985 [Rhincodon typus]